MTAIRVKMGSNGRLVIPALLRKQIGLEAGTSVVIETQNGELRVRPMQDVARRAQKRLQKYLDEGSSLSTDLIADRRAEAKNER